MCKHGIDPETDILMGISPGFDPDLEMSTLYCGWCGAILSVSQSKMEAGRK